MNCCIVDPEDIPNAQKSPGIGHNQKAHGVLEKKKTLFGIFILAYLAYDVVYNYFMWFITLSRTILFVLWYLNIEKVILKISKFRLGY